MKHTIDKWKRRYLETEINQLLEEKDLRLEDHFGIDDLYVLRQMVTKEIARRKKLSGVKQ